MLVMCFSVAPSVIDSSFGDPDVCPALGHGRQDLALAGRQDGERVGPGGTISRATTSGSSAVPPRATRRSASMNSRMSPPDP